MKADIVSEVQESGDKAQRQLEYLIYNVLVVILYMLHAQNTDTYSPDRVKTLIEVVTDDQRAAKGFPTDWRTRPDWAPGC